MVYIIPSRVNPQLQDWSLRIEEGRYIVLNTLKRNVNDRLREMEERRLKRKERKPSQKIRKYFCGFIPEECALLAARLTATDAWAEQPIMSARGTFKNVRLDLNGLWRTDFYLAEDGKIYCPNGESAWIKGVQIYYVELVHLEWLTLEELTKIWTRIFQLRQDMAAAKQALVNS